MRKFLLFFPALLCIVVANAQIEKTINVPYTSSSSPTFQALVYLPTDYSTATTKQYPLLVFCQGAGEAADGGGVSKIYNSSGSGGPAYFIEHGGWPASFTNPVTGAQEQFIVVSPQANTWSVNGDQLANIVNYLVKTYRVDINRIHLTGPSAGGAGVVEYVSQLSPDETPPAGGNSDKRTYPAATVVPMSQATYDPPQSWGNVAVANATPCWGFGDPVNDIHGDETLDYTTVINNAKSGYARFTSFNTGHGPWSPFYNPSYTQSFTWNGKTANYSIYTWMLANTRGGATAPPPPAAPVANAGSAQTITLPANLVTLSGSASTGTITSYSWTKVSGPAGGVITSPSAVSTTVTGLLQGVYTFQLALNGGSVSTVKVTVNAAATPAAPVANAGGPQSITLPVSSVTLSGGASTGTITSYAWTKVSGPSGGTITSPSVVNTAVTGLLQGVYTFQLALNGGSKSTVQVTVNAAAAIPPSQPSSGGSNKFINVAFYGDGGSPYINSQWNDWNVDDAPNSSAFKYSDGTASTVKAALSINESVVDNGSTYGSGMAPAGVLRYTSYCEVARKLTFSGLSASKTYSIEFYASRNGNDGNSTIFQSGTAASTVSTYDNLTNKAILTNLKPNAQGQIPISISTSQSYNYVNGFMITENTGTTTSATGTDAVTGTSLAIDATEQSTGLPAFGIYPNPVRDNFTLELNNTHMGKMSVRIVDQSGAVKHNYLYTKDQSGYTLNLSVGDLSAGVYFITVQIGNWRETKKILKL
jgi:hypothetical protein